MSIIEKLDEDYNVTYNSLMNAFNALSASANKLADLTMQTAVDISGTVLKGGRVGEVYDSVQLYNKVRELATADLQGSLLLIPLLAKISETDDEAVNDCFKAHLLNSLGPQRIQAILGGAVGHIALMQQRMPENPMPGAVFKKGEPLVRENSGGSGEEA